MSNGKKRKIQPKFGPLTVKGEDYIVRINPPIRVYADLTSGNLDRIIDAAQLLVKDHPFLNEEGETASVGDWEVDQVTNFVEAYAALVNALPPVSAPEK